MIISFFLRFYALDNFQACTKRRERTADLLNPSKKLRRRLGDEKCVNIRKLLKAKPYGHAQNVTRNS